MKLLLGLSICVVAFSQEPPAPSKPDQQPSTNAAEKPADTPAAVAGESWLTGGIEVGYQWLGNVGGNPLQYRSVVNLNQGPKLLNLDFSLVDPKRRLFDRVDARADGWGNEPYNTAHLQAIKRRIYDLRADYRNLAYFNAVPSYANPLAPGGFDERSFDIRRRNGYIDLQLFPGRHIKPYLVFERNSSSGHGVQTWVLGASNEFAVPGLLRDSTNNYRGGVRIEYNRYHLSLEQGGTTYKSDDQASFSGTSYGDRTAPFLGQKLLLNNLEQSYGVRGSSVYSKILATARPVEFIDLYGQFLYSNPKTDARYFDTANGSLGMLSPLLLYSGQYDLSASSASQPHIIANAGLEIRPLKGLRVLQSWSSNRQHTAGFGDLTQQILVSPSISGPTLAAALNTRQVINDDRYQIEGIWDLSAKVVFRGGYRREWGDATVRGSSLSMLGPLVSRERRRDVGLAGVTARPVKNAWINLDYEGGTTDTDYFRTSLFNYHRIRARVRYQPIAALTLQANFAVLANENPSLDAHYDLQSRSTSISANWTPAGSRHFSLTAEYSRTTFHSSVDFLQLPFLTPAVSLYRENGHTAVSAVEIMLPAIGGMTAKLTAGGSLFVSSGTRATSYYQPLGRLSLPIRARLQWNTEWRWYGFGETAYLYEAFRAHLFTTGLRFTR